jgi:hypothetical protein
MQSENLPQAAPFSCPCFPAQSGLPRGPATLWDPDFLKALYHSSASFRASIGVRAANVVSDIRVRGVGDL